jgi:hypothetical protein
MNKTLMIFSGFVLLVIIGCAKEEAAPLKDGLFLKYEHNTYGPIGSSRSVLYITFSQVDEDHYRVRVMPVSAIDEVMPPQDEREDGVMIDKYFKLEKGDYFSIMPIGQLWIPSNKREKGAEISGMRVRKILKWRDWKVCMLSEGLAGASIRWYYDITTGFLVGSDVSHMGAGMNSILLETNVPDL